MRHLALKYAAILSLSAACTDTELVWTGTVTDSSGVTIVANPLNGLWDSSAAWVVQEELRIGVLDGDPDYQFGYVQSVGAGQDGRIYVLDQLEKHVRVFSPDGEHERVIGGPGDGPGEMGRFPSFLAVLPGDTLIVNDAPRRVNRYLSDGTVLDALPIEFRNGLPLAWSASPSGEVAIQVRSMAGPQGAGANVDSLDAIVRYGRTRLLGDTMLRIPRGESRVGYAPVYSQEPVWTVGDDLTVLYGVNADYRIGYYRDGSIERVVTKEYDDRPVTDSERAAILSARERTQLAGGLDPAVVAQMRDRTIFGEHVPPMQAIYAGPDGSMWVAKVATFTALTERQQDLYSYISNVAGPQWDVFDREGRFLGEVTMPDTFVPHVFVGEKIYGVVRGDLDEQYVVRLGVVRPSADGRSR